MRHAYFLDSMCDIRFINRRQRHETLVFLKMARRHGTPHQGPLQWVKRRWFLMVERKGNPLDVIYQPAVSGSVRKDPQVVGPWVRAFARLHGQSNLITVFR